MKRKLVPEDLLRVYRNYLFYQSSDIINAFTLSHMFRLVRFTRLPRGSGVGFTMMNYGCFHADIQHKSRKYSQILPIRYNLILVRFVTRELSCPILSFHLYKYIVLIDLFKYVIRIIVMNNVYCRKWSGAENFIQTKRV